MKTKGTRYYILIYESLIPYLLILQTWLHIVASCIRTHNHSATSLFNWHLSAIRSEFVAGSYFAKSA